MKQKTGELIAATSLAVTFGVVSIWGTFADATLDILGDKTGRRTPEEAADIADRYYTSEFKGKSAAGKFTLQFLGKTTVRVDSRPGGNGTLGMFSEGGQDYSIEYNNGCLGNTAYDIDGGELKLALGGLFSQATAEADIPTAAAYAEIDSENPDRLRVVSGNANSTDLIFNGLNEGAQLTPADEPTERILETYGCETGITQSAELTRVGTLDSIDLWKSL